MARKVICAMLLVACSIPALSCQQQPGDVFMPEHQVTRNPDALPYEPERRSNFVRDQEQLQSSGAVPIWSGHSYAQTFKPKVSGQLVAVDLWISSLNGGENYVPKVSIVSTDHGVPNPAQTLATVQVIGLRDFWNWYSLDFSEASVSLKAGTEYAILVTSNAPDYYRHHLAMEWWQDFYRRGRLWQRERGTPWQIVSYFNDVGDADLVFVTWMDRTGS